MLANVEYYDTEYSYTYTQWDQPLFPNNNAVVNNAYTDNNYLAFAPNTGSAGFYVNEGYGEAVTSVFFNESFIPSSLYYRIFSGHSASSGSYNNRLWYLTDDAGWVQMATYPNTGEGRTCLYDLTHLNVPAKAIKFYWGNGGHSYEDELIIYGIRLSGRIRTRQLASPGLWSQPILYSNGTMGVDPFAVSTNVEQLSEQDSKNMYYADYACVHDAYKAFTGSNTLCFHSAKNVTTGYIDIWSKKALKVSKITIHNQAYTTSLGIADIVDNRASAAGSVYGSNNGTTWTKLTDYTNTVQSIAASWEINLASNNTYYHYYRLESTANGGAEYWTIGEIELSAVQDASSGSTSPDLVVTNALVSMPYTSTRKYYKYSPVSWTQPVMTSPATQEFSVASNVPYYNTSNMPWHSMDGNINTQYLTAAGYRYSYLAWWSKTEIKITNIHIINQNYANRASAAGRVLGSRDGYTWDEICTYTNTIQVAKGEWDINMSGNTNYYSFYRLVNDTPGPDASYWSIGEVQITAEGREVVEGTSRDYDFYVDSNTYTAVKQYEKGQILWK